MACSSGLDGLGFLAFWGLGFRRFRDHDGLDFRALGLSLGLSASRVELRASASGWQALGLSKLIEVGLEIKAREAAGPRFVECWGVRRSE